MELHHRPPRSSPAAQRAPNLWRFLRRGMVWKCPECGISPIFVPLRQTHTVRDWFTPLDGCPRCGYAYQRESGYFLMATWGSNYFVVAGLGIALGLILPHFIASMWVVGWITGLLTLAAGLLFARHAKSLYLALDHYFDPHVKPSAAGRPEDARPTRSM